MDQQHILQMLHTFCQAFVCVHKTPFNGCLHAWQVKSLESITSSCQTVRTLFWLSVRSLSCHSTKTNNHCPLISIHMSPDLINICSCSRWAAPGFVDYSKQERVCFLNCCLNDLHFYCEIHLHILQSFLTAPNPISLCKCALCKLFDSSQSYP